MKNRIKIATVQKYYLQLNHQKPLCKTVTNVHHKMKNTTAKIQEIQNIILFIGYNSERKRSYYNVNKEEGLKRIYETSNDIIHEALPIKCLGAVFLGIYLTNDYCNLKRYPISFKTKITNYGGSDVGKIHKHIILAVVDVDRSKEFTWEQARWGSIGISRQPLLCGRDIRYKNLGDLVTSYRNVYKLKDHQLIDIYIGNEIAHCSTMFNNTQDIHWRKLKIKNIHSKHWDDVYNKINSFTTIQ
jgi:tubulinyl-Tyr carboxypeptidase